MKNLKSVLLFSLSAAIFLSLHFSAPTTAIASSKLASSRFGCDLLLLRSGQVVQFRNSDNPDSKLLRGIFSHLEKSSDQTVTTMTLDLNGYDTNESLGGAFRTFSTGNIDPTSFQTFPHPHEATVLRPTAALRSHPISSRLLNLKYGQPIDLKYSWFGNESHFVEGMVRFRRIFRWNTEIYVEIMRSWNRNFDSDILRIPLEQIKAITKGPIQLIPAGFQFQAKTLSGIEIKGVSTGADSFGDAVSEIDESSLLILPPQTILPEQLELFHRLQKSETQGGTGKFGLRLLEFNGPYFIAHTGEFRGVTDDAVDGPSVKLMIEDPHHVDYRRMVHIQLKNIDPRQVSVVWHTSSGFGGD